MNAPACARCGQPITPGARFCTRCGSDVSGEQGNIATARMPSMPAEEAGIEILRRATLGEYDVLAELGRGGMATVYLAHEISLDRKVAIKVMAPQLMFGEGMAERFRREARTAASLSHPHIIPIYAVKESGRVLYFVMKFVAGRPLDDIIRQVGPLPIPMARAILSQVGSALGYAHRRGIVHRDIKPANIMIDDEGWAVVTDFGIAKVAETQGLTMTGVAVGTPSYMSPEQCAAKEVTGRSDQYSLGIVAYEMITGKQPFVADTAMAIMWQHFNDPPQPIRQHRPDCPPELELAVLRMIEKQPDKRWTSIEDAIGAIGATPLAHDDPIHIQMVSLAKSSLNQRLLDEMKTPTSLVPPTRASGKAKTEVMAVVGSVAISPRSANLAAGDTLQLSVMIQDVKGDTLVGREVLWTSADATFATVSSSGLVTALAPGEVVISAAVDHHSGTCQLAIAPVPVVAVVVAPATGAIEAGSTLQLSATLRDPQGKAVTGRAIAWSSSDPAIASVSAQGLVAGSAPGSAKISAGCEGKSGSATLTVEPAPAVSVDVTPAVLSLMVGRTERLTGVVKDRRGHALAGRALLWSSRNPAVAAVSTSGDVSAIAPGTAEIVANAENLSALAKVTVTAVPVARVQLDPPAGPVVVGTRHRLTVLIEDATGKAMDRAPSWASSDPGILPVSATGEITALKAGSAEITVTVEGKTSRALMQVIPVPVASVHLSPARRSIAKGETIQLRAEVRDEKGRVLDDRPVTWSSSTPAVATVSSHGLLVGLRAGNSRITALAGGKSGTAEVEVTAPPAVIEKAPQVSISEAVTQVSEPARAQPLPRQAWARPRVAAGVGLLLLLAFAVWRFGFSGAPAVSGVAVSIEALPAAPNLSVGDSVRLQALYRDSSNQEVSDNRPVRWTSDNPAVAIVSGEWIKAMGGGSATILADAGGLRGTSLVTVRGTQDPGHVPVASIAVAEPPGVLQSGETVQMVVETRDENGASLTGRPVTWTSSNSSVVQVSDAGILTALSAGTAAITGSSEGKTTTFSVNVAPVTVASVSVTPSRSSLEVNDTIRLAAQARDARGNSLEDRPVQWSSDNSRVATVGGDGTVRAVGVGSATITAKAEEKSATASVTVALTRVDVATVGISPNGGELEVGERLQLTAELKAANGAVVRDRTPSWASSDPGVATVSPAGQLLAIAPGTTTITAASDERRATVRVVVARIPVGSLVILSPPSTLAVGESFQLQATARDSRGAPLTDRTINWNSSNAQVVAVTSTGRLTAMTAGSARITASSEGKTASMNLTVPRPPAVAATDTTRNIPPPTPDNPPAAGGAIPRGAIAAGGNHTCGLLAGGVVACWGAGTPSPALLETSVRFTRLSSGTSHSCGLTSAGEAYCWGQNAKGQLGDGSTNNTRATPVAVAGGNSYRILRAGGRHTCGLTGQGRMFCWGENGSGQLGDGTTSGRTRPTAVPDFTFSDIAAGGSHSCGLASDSKTYCWGDGFSGQLGYGQLSTESSPVEVDAGAVKFARIYAGGSHTCGLTSEGKAYCWGDNRASQVGDGGNSDRTRPVPVAGGLTFEELSLGTSHSCGRTGAGSIYCWGANGKGQIGDGARGNRSRPVRVPVEGAFTSLTAGGAHTCATNATQAFCWGENARGQLGDGGTTARPSATPVLGAQ